MRNKLLLFLLTLLLAISATAEVFNINELTSTTNVPVDRLNNRQGFGMNGQFIVKDKALGKINFYNPEDGSVIGTLETGASTSWPAITRDDAGNIIARVDNSWPGNFMADTVIMKIFPFGSNEPIDVVGNIFADFEAENGRCDFFGFIEGNVMDENEGGILWLVTAKSTGILKVPFLGGEIDHDHIALFPVEGATLAPTSSTVVNPYVAADGTKHYMLWTRNANAVDLVMNETEDGFIGTTFTLPNKGATNGCFPFTFGGKDLVIYTTLPNYGNAWAIAEKNAEEPIAVVPEEPGYVTNGFQCNWLNAELVNENKVLIYQYFPGNYFKTYELTLDSEEEHTYAVCGAPAALFGMENDWDPAAAPEMLYNWETGFFEWTSAETELAAGNVEFKIVKDHSWDVCFPEENVVFPVELPGTYTLSVIFDPINNTVVEATLTPLEVYHTYAVCGSPAALFGMENAWDPAAAPEMTLNPDTGLYEWTSTETELEAGNVEFKVVKDHSWDVSYPENNYVIPVEEAGKFTLRVTFNPINNIVEAILTDTPLPPEPTKVYILGEVNGNGWATNVGVEMATYDNVIFTREVTFHNADRIVDPIGDNKYCFFSFSNKLMETADDWDGIAPYRFGAVSEATDDNPNGDFRFYKDMMNKPLDLTYDNGKAFQIEEGYYTLTVNLENMTLTIDGDSFTGIETINVNNTVKSGRYNLLGQPVNENYKGIVIENGVKKIQK